MELCRIGFLGLGGLVAVGVMAGCRGGGGGGAGGAGPRLYDWPIPVRDSQKNPSKLYSTLGEYRPQDWTTWLNHGGTDFVAPRGTAVYSPDVGKVTFGADSDRNAGDPPVKIGHFGMLHFHDVNLLRVNPRVLAAERGIAGGDSWWVYVVNPNDMVTLTANGQPRRMGGVEYRVGSRLMEDGQWKDVFWFNRERTIGEAGDEPDLHVTYYTDAAATYSDRSKLGNALSVIKYDNTQNPVIQVVRFYSQEKVTGEAKERLLDSEGVAQGMMDVDLHKGVDIVVTCSSFERDPAQPTRAGIHKLAYRIDRLVPQDQEPPPDAEQLPNGRWAAPVDPETVMWTYDTMPDMDQDRHLVAVSQPTRRPVIYPLGGTDDISSFSLGSTDRKKYTAYVVTNTGGDDDLHWALEDRARYPDGVYLVRIRAWNIAKAMGEGAAPQLNEASVRYFVKVAPGPTPGLRRLTLSR